VMGKRTGAINTGLLAEAYHQRGWHDRELRVLAENAGAFLDVGVLRARLLRAYAGLRKPAPALALADTMLRDGAGDARAVVLARIMTGADEFGTHGDTVTAALLRARALDWIPTHTSPVPLALRQTFEGIVFLKAGPIDSAIVRFTLAARDTNRIDAAGYLALARWGRGDRAGARAIADSLGALRRPWLFGEHTFWRAAIMGALGERELAVQLLRQAHSEGQPMQSWHYTAPLQTLHTYPAFKTLIRPER